MRVPELHPTPHSHLNTRCPRVEASLVTRGDARASLRSSQETEATAEALSLAWGTDATAARPAEAPRRAALLCASRKDLLGDFGELLQNSAPRSGVPWRPGRGSSVRSCSTPWPRPGRPERPGARRSRLSSGEAAALRFGPPRAARVAETLLAWKVDARAARGSVLGLAKRLKLRGPTGAIKLCLSRAASSARRAPLKLLVQVSPCHRRLGLRARVRRIAPAACRTLLHACATATRA